MLAGESIFLLPFVIARIFRPTMMSALELDNMQLGTCFSVYGIMALIAYFLGGFVTDLVAPRKLMTFALLLTALGGFYLTSFPSYNGMLFLYGYWGVTTILLFWAAMIKATRLWGGEDRQGRAFGFLEAGRGLVASLIGLIGAIIFSYMLIEGSEILSIADKREAFSAVVNFASLFVILVAILVYFFLRVDSPISIKVAQKKSPVYDYWLVAKTPSVFLLMIIILTAYVGYKSTDFISQYALEIMGFKDGESAQIGAVFLFLRPLVAVLIGFAADKVSAVFWVKIGFGAALLGACLFTFGVASINIYGVFFFSTVLLGIGIFGIRALYFALMEEGRIPVVLTGVAVSLISVVGYLPDIFMGPLTGYYLDKYPGELGFKWVFGILAICSFVGLAATIQFKRIVELEP